MNRPLAQRRFLVTRPESQSERLAALLREAGAEPLLAPMIAIGESADPAGLDAALRRLDDFDLAVFVSPTALDQVGTRIKHWPTELAAAVIGPASRERAHELGILDVICPDGRYDSEGLLDHPSLARMDGKRVVLFRGNGGRELLADTLVARGATVEIVEAYRRLPPTMAREELSALLADGCDGVIVTSSEAVHNLFALADEALAAKLHASLFFASHPAIAEAARRAGVGRVITTAAGDAGIVASLTECFAVNDSHIAAAAPPAAAVPADAGWSRPRVERRRPLRVLRALLWLALGIGIGGAALHTFYRYRGYDPQGELVTRLARLETRQQLFSNDEVRDDARLREFDNRQIAVDQRLDEIRAQQADLQALYGAVAGDHEETLLADAELTLSLASQQLQLTGNVGAALAALYRLDERLSGHDKPRLMPLRRALASDIEALKRMPWIDYIGISARLDTLAGGIDALPLTIDAKAREQRDEAKSGERSGLLGELGRALGALVEIRRMDQPDAVLLAPEQALYLREHIKLRLLNARLALLQRDESSFRRDLAAADQELRRRFDLKAKPVIATLKTLGELRAVQPAQALPSLSDSLNAARDARRKASREDSK